MIDALRRAAEVGRFCSIRGFETKVERTSDPESRNWSWFLSRMVKKLRLLKGGSVPTFLVLGRCCTTSLPWTLEEGRRGSQAILDTAG